VRGFGLLSMYVAHTAPTAGPGKAFLLSEYLRRGAFGSRCPPRVPMLLKNLAKVVLLSVEAGVTLSLVIQSLSH
jgi:hypothetical protein